VPVEFGARIIGDITGCHRDSPDPTFTTGIGHIDRVLGKDHRVIVSECNRSTAEPLGGERDLLGRRRIGKPVPLARFGDVPVLTKAAAEIASGRAERQHARSR
jgi:hypothetical protein